MTRDEATYDVRVEYVRGTTGGCGLELAVNSGGEVVVTAIQRRAGMGPVQLRQVQELRKIGLMDR